MEMNIVEACNSTSRVIDENWNCGKQILTDNAVEGLKIVLRAAKKQIKIPPVEKMDGYVCPCCRTVVYKNVKYCSNCGQKMEWSE